RHCSLSRSRRTRARGGRSRGGTSPAGPGRGAASDRGSGAAARRSCCGSAPLLLVAGERDQGDLPGPFQRLRERPLVPRAGARHPPGQDLTPLGDVAPKARDLLVIDVVGLLHAEGTDLAVRSFRLAVAGGHLLLATSLLN